MSRKASSMTLKPAGREARKRSRIVILAPSEADHSLVARHYGLGEVGCQDDSDRLTALRQGSTSIASADEAPARHSSSGFARRVLTTGLSLVYSETPITVCWTAVSARLIAPKNFSTVSESFRLGVCQLMMKAK